MLVNDNVSTGMQRLAESPEETSQPNTTVCCCNKQHDYKLHRRENTQQWPPHNSHKEWQLADRGNANEGRGK